MMANRADNWQDRPGNARPTPERQAKGKYRLGETKDAGVKFAQDDAHDAYLAYLGEPEYAVHRRKALERFEELCRKKFGPVGQRSCLDFEPVGHDNGEGNPKLEGQWKTLHLLLGPTLWPIIFDVAYLRREVVNPAALWDAADICAAYFMIEKEIT